jgi:hypothetical protein
MSSHGSHQSWSFANAFVERMAPVKGVVITNKKFLLGILQRPKPKAQNSAIWENREKIREALCLAFI